MNLILTIVVGGLLGHAIDAGYDGRLAQYINSPQSYAIQLFSPEKIAQGKGGWQGEHAGKWLYAASKAYERTADPAVRQRLVSVADYLISRQEKDGYLGCYREDKRYYHRPGPEAMKVDWDTWIMAYLIKGFTEASVATGDPKYADCALRIVEFLHWTVFDQGIKIAQTGMHAGMAGLGMLDPLCDLYLQRPLPVVREMIDRCIQELDETPCLQLIDLACKGYDVSLIGNGKIYEMCRCLTGMAKAYQLFAPRAVIAGSDRQSSSAVIAGPRAVIAGSDRQSSSAVIAGSDRQSSAVIAGHDRQSSSAVIAGHDRQSYARLLTACRNAWESIYTNHLTTLGGPWGGINNCWEIFNRPAEWAPYECTETCSVMEWMHFTWEMLKITGDGRYASELEKTSYNALLAARAEDGLRWEYYVRTNGELTPRGDWACCWSSGMTALEDIPCYMYDVRPDGLYVNILSESSFDFSLRGQRVTAASPASTASASSAAGRRIRITQTADYAHSGRAHFVLSSAAAGAPAAAVIAGPDRQSSFASAGAPAAAVIAGPDRQSSAPGATLGRFAIAIHRPAWAGSYTVLVNGQPARTRETNGYISIKRKWTAGDQLTIEFPYEIRTLERSWEYRNAGMKEHNFSNWYNGFTKHYITFAAGPLVYATDHQDSFERQNPLKLTRPEIAAAELLDAGAVGDGVDGFGVFASASAATAAVAASSAPAATAASAALAGSAAPAPTYADPVIRVGNLQLRPIAHMPPFGPGPQWRTTWFQIP